MTASQYETQNQTIKLEQGRPFWLNDGENLWQVKEGTVNIYAVTAADCPQYRQVYLFTAEAGHPIFGMSPDISDDQVRLLAVSSYGAVLKIMSRSGILTTAAKGGEHLFEVIWFILEEWLTSLLTIPDYVALPRVFQLLNTGETAALEPGENVRAEEDFVWAQVLKGKVHYGQLPDFTLPAEMSIPLFSQSWLTVSTDESGASIRGISTDQVFSVNEAAEVTTFWKALDECHLLFCKLIANYFAAENHRDKLRLAAQCQQRENLINSASSHLLRSDLPEAILPLAAADQLSPPLLTSIRAIAKQLGIPSSQIRLPKGITGNRQDGSALQQIARTAGMQVRLIRQQENWHREDNGPLLAFWGPLHQPVALLPKSPSQYSIFFPDQGINRALTEQDITELAEEAYVFFSGLPGSSLKISDWIKFSLKKSWGNDYWTILLASLAAGIIPLLTPFVTNTIFTDLIPVNDRQGHIMVIQVMLVAAFASAGVSLTRGVAFLRVKGRSRLAGEAALWMRLLSLPAAFFRRYEVGDLTQRMHAVTQISMLLSDSALSILFNGLFSIFSLAVMFYYSWKLALVAACLLIIYLLIVVLLIRKMITYKRKMLLAAGKVAGQGLQVLTGLSKFRMQGAEAQAFYLWAKEFGEEWKWNRATRWKSNWLEVVNAVQPLLMSMLIFGLTMYWMDSTGQTTAAFISQPDFLSFNSALTGFNVAIMAMVPVLTNLLDIVPNLERLRPILNAKPEVTEDTAEAGELTGQIEINNLSFRYSVEKPPVLQNISLKIRPGQFVAIVGSSGCGKSTLLRLLLGFEQPESGAIYFDGQDLAELSATSVRSQMGVVLQHGQLMSGDIFTNIVGSLPLTLDDAWQAAEMVGFADDIRAMPMGMHTLVSEGASNISGGQRQRILIARSIVNRPRIIVFDEATSALDNRTQAIVTTSLDKLKATRIIVAHRLSTIKKADVIYVLYKGRIIESGNYEDLMELDGQFAALAKRQMA